MAENSQLILVSALIVTTFTTLTAAVFLLISIDVPIFSRSKRKTASGPTEAKSQNGKKTSLSSEIAPREDKKPSPISTQEDKKLSPFYDTQYENLERYLNDNRRQNLGIYRLTVVFISAGFAIIIFGVLLNILNGNSTFENGSWIIIASGVMTEFIAATVLFVYRSVFQQTSEYFRVLERFASVGMSINILDNLRDDTTTKDDSKDDTTTKDDSQDDTATRELIVNAKIEIAKKLLDSPGLVSPMQKSLSDNQPK